MFFAMPYFKWFESALSSSITVFINVANWKFLHEKIAGAKTLYRFHNKAIKKKKIYQNYHSNKPWMIREIHNRNVDIIKVGLSLSTKLLLFIFNGRSLKMMKNALFFFILKGLLVFKIFKFLSWLFWSCTKTAW